MRPTLAVKILSKTLQKILLGGRIKAIISVTAVGFAIDRNKLRNETRLRQVQGKHCETHLICPVSLIVKLKRNSELIRGIGKTWSS